MSRRRWLIGLVTATAAASSLVAAPSAATIPVAAGTVAVTDPAPGSAGGGDPYFPLYGNGGYDVQHYGLRIRYDPGTDRLRGRARLTLRATRDLSRFNLDLVGLQVRDVRVDGRQATWTRRRGHELVITPRRPLREHRTATVLVRYDGKPRTFTDPAGQTYGFVTTSDGAVAVGEPEVAAFWYPVNDHPQDKATYQIRLTVPKGLQAISNGLPGPTTTRAGWSTTTWRSQHPMASYLAFMAVGHFDVHRWRTPKGLPVIDAVDHRITGRLRTRIDASLQRQGEILDAETAWFGPYPFEAAGGVVDRLRVNFALENQTRPVYVPAFWGDDEESFQNDGVVVHELAHQWFGDSVALQRWRDIWLNEGFATYAEWLWADYEAQATPAEILASLYDAIPAKDPFWKIRPGAPGADTLFAGPVYLRGAMTLQALRAKVGEAAFFAILQAWAREHRDGNGTTRQFIALAERLSGRQLDTLFDEWLFQADKPPRPTGATVAGVRPRTATGPSADLGQRWLTGSGRRPRG